MYVMLVFIRDISGTTMALETLPVDELDLILPTALFSVRVTQRSC